MRVTARLVFVLFVLFCVRVMAEDVKKKDGNPVISAEVKLAISRAQVRMFQAKTVLESTPQYRAFVTAQDEMNQLALTAQRDSGCVPPKWQFTQDLDCVAVPQAEKK